MPDVAELGGLIVGKAFDVNWIIVELKARAASIAIS